MKKIEKVIFVEATDSMKKVYQENLTAAIEELQALNLEVEVSHSMCPANKGIGYMYSAVVTGKQA